jgi:hypothetical protein
MFAINAARAMESSPVARINLAMAYRTHQIVEAMLSENIGSLLETAHHG